ncbi:hypothetical protein QUA54_01845 [Microcoleus sp. MOSTC5]|uniref:hypothetical protein n=1 Tax=Microcoleus sp. MOSTC5 TaxID=3055378 RepID=UPI002FD1EC02
MSEKSELSAALKLETVDQLSHQELVKIVLTQQKLIEKLQLQLEKLQERQPSNSFHIIETPIKGSDTEIRDSQSSMALKKA